MSTVPFLENELKARLSEKLDFFAIFSTSGRICKVKHSMEVRLDETDESSG